jgi:hypothetical protein
MVLHTVNPSYLEVKAWRPAQAVSHSNPKYNERAMGVAQVVECLPSMRDALALILSTPHPPKKTLSH